MGGAGGLPAKKAVKWGAALRSARVAPEPEPEPKAAEPKAGEPKAVEPKAAGAPEALVAFPGTGL